QANMATDHLSKLSVKQQVDVINGRQKKKLQQSEVVEEELATEDKKEKKMQHSSDDVGSLLDEKPGVRRVIGVYLIIILILGVYLADHWFQVPEMKKLYLYHNNPVWYQFVTSLFCHVNCSINILKVLNSMGRVVVENEGFFALWIYYIFTGVIASFAGFLYLKGNVVSLGASGAVWGLCAICASIKWQMTWWKTFITLAGIYLMEKGSDRVQPASISSVTLIINTIAHYTGAIAGVGVLWIRSKLGSKVGTMLLDNSFSCLEGASWVHTKSL
ncbi:Rhomboid-like protein 11 protein, partial [Thalictrum thalictroides]